MLVKVLDKITFPENFVKVFIENTEQLVPSFSIILSVSLPSSVFVLCCRHKQAYESKTT